MIAGDQRRRSESRMWQTGCLASASFRPVQAARSGGGAIGAIVTGRVHLCGGSPCSASEPRYGRPIHARLGSHVHPNKKEWRRERRHAPHRRARLLYEASVVQPITRVDCPIRPTTRLDQCRCGCLLCRLAISYMIEPLNHSSDKAKCCLPAASRRLGRSRISCENGDPHAPHAPHVPHHPGR